jgi:transketolase
MRKEFVDQLLVQAENNQDIWLLTADLGYSFLERFEEAFPQRYINVGVAEQNLISVAAGLAMTGKKVFCYSIINFLTFRALEQIRQDICYPKLNVHLIGVGAGFSYKGAGYSHYAIEDIAIMKSLPHITIYSPADALQTAHVMDTISHCVTPSYVRLGKNKTKLHHWGQEQL